MAFETRINESIRGRNLGFEQISSGMHGSTQGGRVLVGPETLRNAATTADTTAKNLRAFGYSVLTTAQSSGVYIIDPPMPGVQKSITFHTTAGSASPIYLKTANGETIGTTQGTTMSILVSSQTGYYCLTMVALTTAAWAVVGTLSSAHIRACTST